MNQGSTFILEHLEPFCFARRLCVCVCACARVQTAFIGSMEAEDYLVKMPSSSGSGALVQLRRLSSLRSARFFRSGAGT